MINWIHLILILGAAQGFFLTILIFHRHHKLYANRFLGGTTGLLSIILLHLLLDELNFYRAIPFVKYAVETLPFFVGPLFYFYARSLISNKKFPVQKLSLHTIPAAGYFIYRLISFIIFASFPKDPKSDPVYEVYNWAITIQGFIYLVLTLSLIKKYTRSLKDMFATLDKVKIDWLRNITLLMLFLLLEFLFENVLFLAGINFSNFYNLTSALLAVTVYALGYMGLSRSEIFVLPEISLPISQLSEIEKQKEKRTGYEKSGLSDEKAKKFREKLLVMMRDDELYRDSNLTLSSLAAKLGISSHNLSEIVNTRLNMNFFDFVNGYRVEQVKKDLSDPAKTNLTLVAIAFDAGFNSKSSFNAIFKKHTGKTPSEYRK